jgi:CRP-like cAMP-binding protein
MATAGIAAVRRSKHPCSVAENLLLASLPAAERARLDPYLTPVDMPFKLTITEPDQPIDYLYFPTNAVTSTVQLLSDGSSIETGLMGLEGLAGVQVWLGQRSTPAYTFVQVPGRGHRMTTADFIREVRRTDSPLNDLVAAYVHAFLVMTSQAAACNRLHTVDERMCRWLSMTHTRVGRDEFPLRQEFLAQMLGVHRPTVSTAANLLQKAGLITYSRGHLRILDRKALEAGSCECYAIMEAQFEKIFDQPWRERAASQDGGGRARPDVSA